MKEERMAVLNMLEKGVITAEEAEKLIRALQDTDSWDFSKEEISSNLTGALNKAGDVIGSFAKTVGEKAEEAAKEVEPIIKKMAHTMADKAASAAEEVKNFAEKKKQQMENEKVDEDEDDEYYDLSEEFPKEQADNNDIAKNNEDEKKDSDDISQEIKQDEENIK